MQTFQPFLQHSGVVVGQLQYFWHITKPIPCLDQSVITAVHLVVSYLVIPSWILSAMKALDCSNSCCRTSSQYHLVFFFISSLNGAMCGIIV